MERGLAGVGCEVSVFMWVVPSLPGMMVAQSASIFDLSCLNYTLPSLIQGLALTLLGAPPHWQQADGLFRLPQAQHTLYRPIEKGANDDATKADFVFNLLMGGEVPPRRAFIQAHAKSVKNLDI